MSYFKTYFRIRSEYDGYNGWSDMAASEVFKEEVNGIFSSIGWSIKKARSSGICDTAFCGKESLYLHPMHFSGVILKSSIPVIEDALAHAKSFKYYSTDVYEQCFDMTDEEYLMKLKEQQNEMIEDFLRSYRTKRRNLYITSDVSEKLKRKYKINRVGEGHDDVILDGILKNVFSMLLARGDIVKGKTRNGTGYRTVTDYDRKPA